MSTVLFVIKSMVKYCPLQWALLVSHIFLWCDLVHYILFNLLAEKIPLPNGQYHLAHTHLEAKHALHAYFQVQYHYGNLQRQTWLELREARQLNQSLGLNAQPWWIENVNSLFGKQKKYQPKWLALNEETFAHTACMPALAKVCIRLITMCHYWNCSCRCCMALSLFRSSLSWELDQN